MMMGVFGLFSFCCLGWQTDLLRNENNRFVEERKDAFAALAKQNQEMSSRTTNFSEKIHLFRCRTLNFTPFLFVPPIVPFIFAR